jgi:hypothetical protein
MTGVRLISWEAPLALGLFNHPKHYLGEREAPRSTSWISGLEAGVITTAFFDSASHGSNNRMRKVDEMHQEAM